MIRSSISFRPGTFLRAVAVLSLCAALFACAKPEGVSRVAAEQAVAQAVWDRFSAAAERAESTAGPFRVNATLYYSGKEDSQRVTVYFWGNGEKTNPLPLRLDILMGPGSVMASAREDARGLFIFAPRDETVYHAGERGLLAFGVPFPFSLADLAAMLNGRFAAVFAPHGLLPTQTAPAAVIGADGSLRFAVTDAPLAGYLTLSQDGLPVSWDDGVEGGWRLNIDYWPDSTRTTPRKLHIQHGDGAEATLIVRELAFPEKAFTGEQLRLKAPPNTRLAPLTVAQ